MDSTRLEPAVTGPIPRRAEYTLIFFQIPHVLTSKPSKNMSIHSLGSHMAYPEIWRVRSVMETVADTILEQCRSQFLRAFMLLRSGFQDQVQAQRREVYELVSEYIPGNPREN
jgi:hypothetical protein